MSAPSPYAQRSPPAETKEDCRDYLRTGRCKYGASCKYNHPPNVQSGGGMKAPLDPSEPMFPVRPNEPMCQYYMKHGTCKFGQACKFHHPPQASLPAGAMDGNSMLSGGVRKIDSQQMQWNSAGAEANVQMLPQRPDEPNCIFFLKNGRCKYGATCRYHHPLNYHDRRIMNDDGWRQHIQVQQVSGESVPKIHYVTSLPPGAYQQGHFVVSDGAVTFLSIDGSTPAQLVSVPQGGRDSTLVYASSGSGQASRPLGLSREVASSSSSASIASSYETANSNVDQVSSHGDSSSSLWNRPKKSNSGSSLSAYNVGDGSAHGRSHVVHGGRTMIGQNVSDGSMNLPRVVSSGSTGESGIAYYETTSGPVHAHAQSHGQSRGTAQWRGKRSNSFDQVGPSVSTMHGRDEDPQDRSGLRRVHDDEGLQRHRRDAPASSMMRGRPPPGSRPQRRPQNVEVDDGLSMMTSALLTMLDTPQEAAAAAEANEMYYEDPRGAPSYIQNPQLHQQYSQQKGEESPSQAREESRHYQTGHQRYSHQQVLYEQRGVDDHVLGIMNAGPQNRMDLRYKDNRLQKAHEERDEDQNRWSPTWQAQGQLRRPLQENSHSMQVMQSPPSPHSPHESSNVGLYLP